MSENKIESIMGTTMDKIKAMASADTIIGDPIEFGGIYAVPVSKVSYGFASGGSDFPSKNADKEMFGGGGGAGMTVTPIAFLVIQGNSVKVMHIDTNPSSADKVVEMIPDFFDRVVGLFKKEKKTSETVISETAEEIKIEHSESPAE